MTSLKMKSSITKSLIGGTAVFSLSLLLSSPAFASSYTINPAQNANCGARAQESGFRCNDGVAQRYDDCIYETIEGVHGEDVTIEDLDAFDWAEYDNFAGCDNIAIEGTAECNEAMTEDYNECVDDLTAPANPSSASNSETPGEE